MLVRMTKQQLKNLFQSGSVMMIYNEPLDLLPESFVLDLPSAEPEYHPKYETKTVKIGETVC